MRRIPGAWSLTQTRPGGVSALAALCATARAARARGAPGIALATALVIERRWPAATVVAAREPARDRARRSGPGSAAAPPAGSWASAATAPAAPGPGGGGRGA